MSDSRTSETAESARVFESYRSLLESVAYRMLGSLAEAQDAVQDTFLRWMRANPAEVRSPKSWLVAACSRVSLDVLKSARVRRTDYVGPWLPEPYLDSAAASLENRAEVDETVSMALMVALETLSPDERAAFLLHDVFDYRFEEIGVILGKSPAACRKLGSRARQALRAEKPKFSASTEEHRALVSAFLSAARAGDVDGLTALLTARVELRSDGGGKATAARRPVRGADAVARFLTGVLSGAAGKRVALDVALSWHNGAPGAVVFENGVPVTAVSVAIEAASHKIHRIYAVRNPDKLASFREACAKDDAAFPRA